MNEGDVLGQVRGYLEAHGFYVVRVLQGIGAHKGISDLIVVGRGKTAFVEIKCNSDQSPKQIIFEAEVKRRGGIYIVARCIEDVQTLIGKGE